MRRLANLQILGASLLVMALAAGTGVVLSQGTPGTESDKQPCRDHPCAAYAYVAHYFLADGQVNAVTTWDLNVEGPARPEAAFLPRPGMASVVISDPAGRQMMKDLFQNANAQDYYIDLGTFTLKKRALSVPIPSSTAQSSAWSFGDPPGLPPLALAAGVGLSMVVLVSARRRTPR